MVFCFGHYLIVRPGWVGGRVGSHQKCKLFYRFYTAKVLCFLFVVNVNLFNAAMTVTYRQTLIGQEFGTCNDVSSFIDLSVHVIKVHPCAKCRLAALAWLLWLLFNNVNF